MATAGEVVAHAVAFLGLACRIDDHRTRALYVDDGPTIH